MKFLFPVLIKFWDKMPDPKFRAEDPDPASQVSGSLDLEY